MPRIVDAAREFDASRLHALRNSQPYREFKARRAGEPTRNAKEFVRSVVGIHWRWRCAYCGCMIAERDNTHQERRRSRHYPFIDEDDMLALMNRYFPGVREWTDDHVLPESRSGDYIICNIVPACKQCNTEKDNQTSEEFLRSKELSEIEIAAWFKKQTIASPHLEVLESELSRIKQS